VTFLALRLTSGDPVASLLAQGLASVEQADALRHQLGLDLPLLQQYLRFLTSLLRGDLGRSLYTGQPVTQIISAQLPYTAQLAAAGLAVALVLGLLLGLLATREDRQRSLPLASGVAGLATALPVAFTGILAILAAIAFRAAPTLLRGITLPALVLGFSSSGAIARLVQAGLQETLSAPFILAARARGLRRGPRLLWHALRPALPPVISLIAVEAAFLFGGTVVTESVFSRPGLGRLLVASILQGDYPIAQGLVVLSAVADSANHNLADVFGLALDPRLRRSE